MKKTVLKTVGFTVLGIFIALIVFFSTFFVFFPRILGHASKELGNHGAAVYFYEREYEKQGRLEDLAILVYELDVKKDAEKTVKYTGLAIEQLGDLFSERQEDFKDSCSAKEYFYTKICLALIEVSNVDAAVVRANEFVNDGECGYTNYNPYRIMISSKGSSLSKEDLLKIKAGMVSVREGVSDKALLDSDVATIDSLLLNK